MSRYGGYSDTLEVLVDLLKEQRRTNKLLEQLIGTKEPEPKPAQPLRGKGKAKGDAHGNE